MNEKIEMCWIFGGVCLISPKQKHTKNTNTHAHTNTQKPQKAHIKTKPNKTNTKKTWKKRTFFISLSCFANKSFFSFSSRLRMDLSNEEVFQKWKHWKTKFRWFLWNNIFQKRSFKTQISHKYSKLEIDEFKTIKLNQKTRIYSKMIMKMV